MLTSLTTSTVSHLLSLLLFLFPAVLFKGCEAVNLNSHTPALPSTPVSRLSAPVAGVLTSDILMLGLIPSDARAHVSIPSDLVSPGLSTPAADEGPNSTGSDGGSRKQPEGGEQGLQVVKHFYLWTRRNSGNSSAQFLDPSQPETIINSSFRPRKTFIIVHGFLGWGTEPWILYLKDKLLRTIHSNVISVEWPAGTAWWLPSYYTAVSQVPYVAKDLVALLLGLVTHWRLDLMDVHLIGHSLGAHVTGLAAAPLRTVGRISGLDPAGLMYHNVSSSERLDASDANYVDIIHTNGCTTLNKWLDCYGINENIGHSDFWPNGGRYQPSCGARKGTKNGEIGCNHEMAYIYYIESLDYSVDQTFFVARPCGSWDDYSGGVCGCGKETQYMGFSVNVGLNGTFYLSTNATSPYAVQDGTCLPGSATGSGVRMIEFVLITTSALIVIGACAGALVLQLTKRRGASRRGSVREQGGSVASGVGGGGESSGCVCSGVGGVHGSVVVVCDSDPLLP